MSDYFTLTCKALGICSPTTEFKFHPDRRWRIDFAFPEVKLAVEIEGGIWKTSRHTHPSGFMKDIEKYNALTELGWHLLRYIPQKINYDQIKRIYDKLNVNQRGK
jgi:very-short-patch-repair endonuclease